MSTLWKALTSTIGATITVGGFIAVMAWDLHRPPGIQVGAAAYVLAVQAYQHTGRHIAKRLVVCRYDPSCSDYSLEAVRRHGLVDGVRLTISRLSSCTGRVPLGTRDPVPPRLG